MENGGKLPWICFVVAGTKFIFVPREKFGGKTYVGYPETFIQRQLKTNNRKTDFFSYRTNIFWCNFNIITYYKGFFIVFTFHKNYEGSKKASFYNLWREKIGVFCIEMKKYIIALRSYDYFIGMKFVPSPVLFHRITQCDFRFSLAGLRKCDVSLEGKSYDWENCFCHLYVLWNFFSFGYYFILSCTIAPQKITSDSYWLSNFSKAAIHFFSNANFILINWTFFLLIIKIFSKNIYIENQMDRKYPKKFSSHWTPDSASQKSISGLCFESRTLLYSKGLLKGTLVVHRPGRRSRKSEGSSKIWGLVDDTDGSHSSYFGTITGWRFISTKAFVTSKMNVFI